MGTMAEHIYFPMIIMKMTKCVSHSVVLFYNVDSHHGTCYTCLNHCLLKATPWPSEQDCPLVDLACRVMFFLFLTDYFSGLSAQISYFWGLLFPLSFVPFWGGGGGCFVFVSSCLYLFRVEKKAAEQRLRFDT